jgi:hypothetical protein
MPQTKLLTLWAKNVETCSGVACSGELILCAGSTIMGDQYLKLLGQFERKPPVQKDESVFFCCTNPFEPLLNRLSTGAARP